jgi:hypothetical protein
MQSCPPDATTDDVLRLYSDDLRDHKARLVADTVAYIRGLHRRLGIGGTCMSRSTSKGLYRNIRCVSCDALSRLTSGTYKNARFALQSGEQQGQELTVSAHALQHHLSDNGILKAVLPGTGGVIDIVLYPFDHLFIVQVILASIVAVGNEMATAFICNKTGYIINMSGKVYNKKKRVVGDKKGRDRRPVIPKDIVGRLFHEYYVNYNLSDTLIGDGGLFCLDSASIGFESANGKTRFQIRPDTVSRAGHEQADITDTFVFSQRVADMFTSRMLSRESERIITAYYMLQQIGVVSGELLGRVFDRQELELLVVA